MMLNMSPSWINFLMFYVYLTAILAIPCVVLGLGYLGSYGYFNREYTNKITERSSEDTS